MINIDEKIERWKNRLLDLGRRNRLINYRETKRGNISILAPSYDALYEKLVQKEEELKFSYPLKTIYDEEGNENNLLIQDGDIKTNVTINEQQKTLKVLRLKAKTSMEEQGVNILYLSFGLIKWRESNDSNILMTSPLILVPVTLTVESITSPYILKLHEDEIVVNPSLSFKFENDFGIILPEFDGHEDNITEYFEEVRKVLIKNDWEVLTDVNLSLLSFLKINMYKDLNDNKDRIVFNPIIKALTGDLSEIERIPNELENYNHDINIRPIDTYQVVDADSSQQDAILLSKKGASFVLQGPPGTGKSQTITNIIAEAMADGKKVLFVSEKMAALEVVKKRLSQSGLGDFCLTLHSHKANKKEVLEQLGKVFKLKKIKVQEEAVYKLQALEEKRNKLNEYNQQLHTPCIPLNKTVYEVNGMLANLSETQDVIFEMENIVDVNVELLNRYKYLLGEFSKTIGKLSEDYDNNPWYGCNVKFVTHELRHDIDVNLQELLIDIKNLVSSFQSVIDQCDIDIAVSVNNINQICEMLEVSSKSPVVPENWMDEDLEQLSATAQYYMKLFNEYKEKKEELSDRYNPDIYNLCAKEIVASLEPNLTAIKEHLNNITYKTSKDIVINSLDIMKNLKKSEESLKDAFQQSCIVSNFIEIDLHDRISSIYKLTKLIELILKNPKPTSQWLDNSKLSNVTSLLSESHKIHSELLENIKFVCNVYESNIIDINYNEILKRFINEYSEIFKIIAQFNGLESEGVINRLTLTSFVDNQVEDLKELLNLICEADNSMKLITQMFEIKEITTLKGIADLSELVGAILEDPKPTEAWFDVSKTKIIDKLIEDIKLVQQEIKVENEYVLLRYNKDILGIDCKQMLFKFNTEYTSVFKYFKKSYREDKNILRGFSRELNNKVSDNNIIAILNKLVSIKEKEQWLKDNKSFATELLGKLYVEDYTDWSIIEKNRKVFSNIAKYFSNNIIPNKIKDYLIESDNRELEVNYNHIIKINSENVSSRIDSIQNKNVDNVHINGLKDEIENIITLSIQIKQDYNIFSDFLRNKSEADDLTQIGIIENLRKIKIIQEKRDWIDDHREDLKLNFGKHYIGELTNWDNIKESFGIVQEIRRFFGEKSLPNKLSDILQSGDISSDIFSKAKNSFEELKNNGIVQVIYNLLSLEDVENTKINKLLEIIDMVKNKVDIAQMAYESFSVYAKENKQYENIMVDILILDKIQKIQELINDDKCDLQSKYQFLFDDMNTNWQIILSSLEWTYRFKKINDKVSLSREFIKEICQNSDKAKIVCEEGKNISKQKTKIDKNFNWFSLLFDDGNEFYKTNLYKLIDRIDKCLNNLSLLEEWIDFRSIREQCRDVGLKEYIEKVEQMKIKSDLIVNTFLKRFYRLWLDAAIPQYTSIQSFRSRSQESMIKEFRELDTLQFNIARSRIKEKLIANLPDVNIVTAAFDEVGILKRELTKQRKIMPLRKLFKSIPNLLTALKPCLMMSPLSVSLFLQAKGYTFDIVIFDEASQVCTEDAIGAIMRGKQVIIAGDNKQLPPTNFFAASLSDGDFDVDDNDESYDDTGAYDSILEEALNAIPERTLRWHYRSRHEHLIAFSNAKIYDHNLITFPSNIEKVADNGVEYVYVSDGVYDRGGKKHNVNEAKKVAELVFEHFKKHPHRSLGVITFSESQQQAVDAAIRQARFQNNQYEKFFSEDNEDAFFIKNLENVQGDERDTIIFSIGYAKDSNGVMYMNFGPLSRNGGHRRLNVAITRAKFNVKLVGSIHPTDINIEKINSDGVKMLRSYIEFAINGASVLQNEINYSNVVNVESPFEEAVYDFLVKHGYSVVTQVGCSGYRIDMAVKHPALSGRFILGIECDGATYHNARTARERDRLRQTILEDIGWKIHRIWSTDWIKDPLTEGNKLLEVLKIAIENYTESYNNELFKSQEDYTEKVDFNIEKVVSQVKVQSQINNNSYGFTYYKEANLMEVQRHDDDIKYVKEVIKHIVNVEYPIHIDILYKRIAPLFGNQKATVKIRNSVNYVIADLEESELQRKDDFLLPLKINDIPVRIPSDGDSVRPINYIYIEEIAKAMTNIIEKSFGIVPHVLFGITAKEFGFNRKGNNITSAMKDAYEYLLNLNKVKEIDGKIVLAED